MANRWQRIPSNTAFAGQRAEQEWQRANQAESALAEERRQHQALLEKLRELGIDPNQL